MPLAQRLARGLRFCGAALALHGILFGLCAAAKAFLPGTFELLADVFLWVLAVPALLLASPFGSVLWTLGLMNAPGWFAWPKPLGIALAYVVWVAVAFGFAEVLRRWPDKDATTTG